MSDKTNTEAPVQNITSMPETDPANLLVEKRPNFAVRAIRKIKTTPPKTAFAVAGGVALVAVGAALGRSSAPYHVEIVESDLELEPVFQTPASDESTDTVA